MKRPFAYPQCRNIYNTMLCGTLTALGIVATCPAHADPTTSDSATFIAEEINEDEATDSKPKGGYFSLGVGFDTYRSYIVGAEVGHSSLFGIDGLAIRQRAELSGLAQTLEFTLAGGPELNGPWLWEVGGIYQDRLLRLEHELGEQRYGGHAQLGYQLSQGWTAWVGSGVEQRSLQNAQILREASGGLDGHATAPDHTLTSLWLELEYHSNTYDAQFDLIQGLHFTGRLKGSDSISDDPQFLQGEAQLAYGLELPWHIHLTVEGKVGAFYTETDDGVPFFDRYRLGGPYGFAGQFLSPTGPQLDTPDGDLSLGGTGVAFGRTEINLPLYYAARLYAFGGVEAGALRDDLTNLDQVDWAASGYGGVRWLSPIGEISTGIGVPINRSGDRQLPPVFMFGLGNSF